MGPLPAGSQRSIAPGRCDVKRGGVGLDRAFALLPMRHNATFLHEALNAGVS
jgi:hypothetical protein